MNEEIKTKEEKQIEIEKEEKELEKLEEVKKEKNKKITFKLPKFFTKLSKKIQTTIVLIALVIIAITLIGLFSHTKDSELTTVVESSIVKVAEISEISTMEYTYNAVATKKNEKDKVLYYVAYEGKVIAGIDYNDIQIKTDKKKKKIIIIIPEVDIQSVSVDINTMDYIFKKDKYETETVTEDAYRLCIKDLEKRTEEEKFKEQAKANTITTIEALFTPMIQAAGDGYTLEVK